ncbi:MAG TPA: DUF1592 domain-containing protein [Pirellulales bacterium]|nr:DUF1592 domain-containing protein [Pirellulales bacterium]
MNWTTLPRQLHFCRSAFAVSLCLAVGASRGEGRDEPQLGDRQAVQNSIASESSGAFAGKVRPIVTRYCLSCHSAKEKKGELDLERFSSIGDARHDLKAWQSVIEMLEAGEMPPKEKPQPTPDERKVLISWAREFLDAEARARVGDPGPAPLRRLSNAEYDRTVRDLTGVDLAPAREFPADGAAGEGFTNAAEALSMSPALVDKYLAAAKQIADHAVFLPDGFRFSVSSHQRDWVDECLTAVRGVYNRFADADGRLPIRRYLSALAANRKALAEGTASFDDIARRENLSAKYLKTLWDTLSDEHESFIFDGIHQRWKAATPANVGELAAEIETWQKAVWKLDHRAAGIYEPWQKPANWLLDLQPAFLMPLPAEWRADLDRQLDEFRRVFPIMLCFGKIVPRDPDGITLRLFCREDEPLARLMLTDGERKQLDRVWQELQYVGREAEREREEYPLFMGFASQVGLVPKFQPLKEPIKARADEFQKQMIASEAKHLAAVFDFAARAYRRPLAEQEKSELNDLYHALQAKRLNHEEAMRGVLTKVFVSPSFLFHLEQSPPGKEPREVSDWELASRLSYFLWSSLPDDELRQVAASGMLHKPVILEEQTRRMLKDGRVRALAIEFGAQSLHVHGFDEQKEKNERLFPTFDAGLRSAIYEETILFFEDLFQSDRPITDFLDADYTFLNEMLARHYGIPDVAGPQWRRVEGVKKFGRGGVLGLASVQTSQSGASRTSPVLRGNWVVETLLGERMPRPPANVPKLPEEETRGDGLSVRQLVEKHASDAACAVCHVRIDPFGFALESYDAIGRRRDVDLGGAAIDCRVRLKDGTEFEGIDGLRNYLLTKKRDVVIRLFCRRLLGYAIGRATTPSDRPTIDDMIASLDKNDGRLSAAVLAIVRSPQFRLIRGSEFAGSEVTAR